MKSKINQIEKEHDNELRNTLMVAKYAASEFFKIQGKEINDQYNRDIAIILNENVNLKKALITEETKVMKLIE